MESPLQAPSAYPVSLRTVLLIHFFSYRGLVHMQILIQGVQGGPETLHC